MSIPELRANPDGIYYAYWSEARRSKRKSMGTSNPTVAQERFAHWLLLRNTTPETAAKVFTVEDCWKVYIQKSYIAEGRSTMNAVSNWRVLGPFFGSRLVSEVDQDLFDAYETVRTSGAKPVKRSTVRTELLLLRAALRFCAHRKRNMLDPKMSFHLDLPPVSEPRDRWLTEAEMKRLLDQAADERGNGPLGRTELFLNIALYTAGRMQAVLELTWDRVDFETGVIHLNDPSKRETKKRRASVPIADPLMPILQKAYGERVNGHVFKTQSNIWISIQDLVVRAGFPVLPGKKRATGISPHVLRHTAATHMARRGVPLWIVAKVLGNSVEMVERVYAKHSPEDLREAVNVIRAEPKPKLRAVG